MNPALNHALALSLGCLVLASGCVGPSEGTLQLRATDGPGDVEDFLSVQVRFTDVHVHREGQAGADASEGNETGPGWTKVAIPFNRQTVDLLTVLDGKTWEFLNKSLEPGAYTQVRLEVENARGTLKNGTQVRLDASPTMKFVHPFEIEAGRTTRFVADLSVVRVGEDSYRVQPNLGSTKVEGPA